MTLEQTVSVKEYKCQYCGAYFALERMLRSHRVKERRYSRKQAPRHCLTTDELAAKGWLLKELALKPHGVVVPVWITPGVLERFSKGAHLMREINALRKAV